MGWNTKWPEIRAGARVHELHGRPEERPEVAGGRPDDRDVADELFGRRGGQAEDEVVDVRRQRAAGFDLVDADRHERRDRARRRRERVVAVDPVASRGDGREEAVPADEALAGRAGRPGDGELHPAGGRLSGAESHVRRQGVLLPGRDRNAGRQKGHGRSPGGVRAGQQRRARRGRAGGVERRPCRGAVGVGVVVEGLQVRVERPSGDQVLSQSGRGREDEHSGETEDATTHDGPPRRKLPRAKRDQAADSRTTAMP